MTISRRFFLAITGAAVAAPLNVFGQENVPTLLDHILLGCNNLDRGISFVEERTGVRAAFGGVHPGRGTRNALLSLGTRRYLEIIAPDPQQARPAHPNDLQSDLDKRHLRELNEPRLIGWAAHPGNIQSLAARLAQSGITAEGPTPGSRKRPDGKVLHWNTLTLQDDASGLLPFFIEWSGDSLHPSADSPAGCSLIRFEATTPHPDMLSKQIAVLDLDVPIVKADKSQLRATISGPKGQFSVTS